MISTRNIGLQSYHHLGLDYSWLQNESRRCHYLEYRAQWLVVRWNTLPSTTLEGYH